MSGIQIGGIDRLSTPFTSSDQGSLVSLGFTRILILIFQLNIDNVTFAVFITGGPEDCKSKKSKFALQKLGCMTRKGRDAFQSGLAKISPRSGYSSCSTTFHRQKFCNTFCENLSCSRSPTSASTLQATKVGSHRSTVISARQRIQPQIRLERS